MSNSLQEAMISNDYYDYIIPSIVDLSSLTDLLPEIRVLKIDSEYSLLIVPAPRNPALFEFTRYNTIPNLFMLQDTTSLEVSGITQVQNLTNLNLTGEGVLIGFIDTGIDYTNRVFRDAAGNTRIEAIWDQSIQGGPTPENFPYGTEYLKDDIDRALRSENPQEVVPSTDTNGHGTFLASITAGTAIPEEDFIGAAPRAAIAMVKLKEAKNYLKEFFYFSGSDPVFQESDIIIAYSYLRNLALKLHLPLVVCIGLGTNQGDHAGGMPLSSVLSGTTALIMNAVVVATGNEAGRAHHFFGELPENVSYETVEVLVPEGSSGFFLELWVRSPDAFSVGFVSPTGEVVNRIPFGLNNTVNAGFILDPTTIEVHYETVQTVSGSQLIFMRFRQPSPGIWRIRVYGPRVLFGTFHMWLPIYGFTDPDIVFLQPDAYTTLTSPSDASNVVATGTYDAYTNGLYLNSGRGNTALGIQKPDFCAPGVNLTGMNTRGNLTSRTGSCLAAGLTAGSAALIMEWGLRRNPYILFNSAEIRDFLIRGTVRDSGTVYPNREWGYGKMNVYRSFASFFER